MLSEKYYTIFCYRYYYSGVLDFYVRGNRNNVFMTLLKFICILLTNCAILSALNKLTSENKM